MFKGSFLGEPPVEWLVWAKRVKVLTDRILKPESGPFQYILKGFNQANSLDGNEDQQFYDAKNNLLKGLRECAALLEDDTLGELLEIEEKKANIPNESKTVFIGHGNSRLWKDLRDLLKDRLDLQWEEFNRESTAGLSNKERLEVMLSKAGFAFLVLTAEDEHVDKTFHARESVIHELGLFQGKLGFKKAIVLMEEGCEEFGNIHGLVQIRFPKGDITAKSEEIRRVLEREGLIT